MEKIILLHFHIFKNGGTTVEWILKNKFSKNATSIDTDDPKGILSNEKIIGFVKNHPNIQAISSHQIRFPLPNLSNFKFIPILFIRHPIDRIFSIYNFNRKRTDFSFPSIVKAKELEFNDYVKWNLDNRMLRTMKNFQVRFLSDKKIIDEINENDLVTAIERMKKCTIIGMVDRFDESLTLAEKELNQYFTNIDLSYISQNVDQDTNKTLEQKLEKIKTLLDSSVYENIINQNELDFQLYLETTKELENRITEFPQFTKKLHEFQLRCKKLNGHLV